MGTSIRPEISKRSRYWLPKHRLYELKHFCMQYCEWRKRYVSLTGYARATELSGYERVSGGYISDPTEREAEARLYFAARIEMVESAVKEAVCEESAFYAPMLRAVTEDISYSQLNARDRIPCCSDTWYSMYRRFFWILDRKRG